MAMSARFIPPPASSRPQPEGAGACAGHAPGVYLLVPVDSGLPGEDHDGDLTAGDAPRAGP